MKHLCMSTILLALTAGLTAADGAARVVGPDRLVIDYHGIPIAFELAHLEVDPDPEGSAACQARLEKLVAGQPVQVIFKDGFEADAGGTGKVHVRVGGQDVNQVLVAEGLARYIDSGDKSAYARLLSLAQGKAEREELGLWGRPPVVATVAPAEPIAAPDAAPSGSAPQGPYCAELSGSQYFAADDPRVAQLNQGSLIYYRSESAARRAGKRPAPAVAEVSLGAGEEGADALLAAGKDLYSQAIAAGNTSRRDDLYGESFGKFTAAMQIYSQLVDATPNDKDLSEKLRETMQFRYGAMKQRRF